MVDGTVHGALTFIWFFLSIFFFSEVEVGWENTRVLEGRKWEEEEEEEAISNGALVVFNGLKKNVIRLFHLIFISKPSSALPTPYYILSA